MLLTFAAESTLTRAFVTQIGVVIQRPRCPPARTGHWSGAGRQRSPGAEPPPPGRTITPRFPPGARQLYAPCESRAHTGFASSAARTMRERQRYSDVPLGQYLDRDPERSPPSRCPMWMCSDNDVITRHGMCVSVYQQVCHSVINSLRIGPHI